MQDSEHRYRELLASPLGDAQDRLLVDLERVFCSAPVPEHIDLAIRQALVQRRGNAAYGSQFRHAQHSPSSPTRDLSLTLSMYSQGRTFSVFQLFSNLWPRITANLMALAVVAIVLTLAMGGALSRGFPATPSPTETATLSATPRIVGAAPLPALRPKDVDAAADAPLSSALVPVPPTPRPLALPTAGVSDAAARTNRTSSS